MTEEEQRRVDYIKQKIWDGINKQKPKVHGPRKDWMDLLIDYFLELEYKRKDNKKKMKKREEALKNGFQGDPLNFEDVLKYENLIGGKVVASYEEADGTRVRIYEDGNVARICYTLTSVFPSIKTQNKCFGGINEVEQSRKEALSSYLCMPSFEVSKLDWCEIDDLVLERSKNDGPIKQLKYKRIEKIGRKNV